MPHTARTQAAAPDFAGRMRRGCPRHRGAGLRERGGLPGPAPGRRATKGALGPADGSRGMIDAVHHAANTARIRSLAAARELMETALVVEDPRFFAALEAVLEVLPVSARWTGIDPEGETAAAADDFEALCNLSRLAWRGEIDEPEQIELRHDRSA